MLSFGIGINTQSLLTFHDNIGSDSKHNPANETGIGEDVGQVPQI